MAILEKFHHRISGNPQGPKLIFLHGLMGYWANWRGITPSFEDQYHILVYDQRGHGRSPKPDTGYSPEEYADDLLHIVDELGWDKFNLVGHSMGGRNAMYFTANFPQRIIKLVIEDIGPNSDDRALPYFQGLLGSIPTPFHDRRKAKEFLYNDLGDPVVGAYLYSNLEEKTPGVWDWRFSPKGIIESVTKGQARERWEEFRRISRPTLLIRGEKSRHLPRDIFERCLKENKNVQGIEIEGSGHWVHYDKPKEFIQAVSDFLGSD